MHDPVLQLDQLALQPQQLLEIHVAIDRFVGRPHAGRLFQNVGEPRIVELQLELFVDRVEHFVLEAFTQRIGVGRLAIHQDGLQRGGEGVVRMLRRRYDELTTTAKSDNISSC